MKFEYLATRIGFDDDDDTITVGFGGLPDANSFPTIGLTLQRSTNEDEDARGIDGLYVEWCDQEMSGYGYINEFLLYRDGSKVIFTDDADFRIPPMSPDLEAGRLAELLIYFDVDEDFYEELKRRLSAKLFIHCDGFAVQEGKLTS